MDDAWFRIQAVIEAAIEVSQEPPPAAFAHTARLPRSDRARAAVARLSMREEPEIREVCNALVEAVVGLETDVRRLRQHTQLAALGVEMTPRLVGIGADGLTLPKRSRWAEGTRVRVWLDLTVRNNDHLLCMPAEVVAAREDHQTEIAFIHTDDEPNDLLVAFVFEQQAKERRRVLDRV